MSADNSHKKQTMLALLADGNVFVALDPRREAGASVPEQFRCNERLILQIGPNIPPRPDLLDIGDDGFSAMLSFNRSPFVVVVPWSAVQALSTRDGRGHCWVPAPQEADRVKAIAGDVGKSKRPRLRLIKGGKS
jgi:stringent starvation protein B